MTELLAFGPFVLDTQNLRLLRNGSSVAVSSRALKLLQVLIEAGGRSVSKSALMEAVWNSATIEESNLTVQIAALRKALGRSPDGGEWIATVQRVGYQFVHPPSGSAHSSLGGRDLNDRTEFAVSKPSIAVLPFVNLSGDPAQEYFADGIAEEIIIALSRFSALFVIARDSSFTYRGRNVDIKQVGRELGVSYVLVGSLRKFESRVRISVELVGTTHGTHIWAERFEGSLSDIFDLQDQLTAKIVGAIEPKLERAEIERARRKPTESLDAHDYYLRGVSALHDWTQEGNTLALECFYKSFALDSEFAAAYGYAARAYVQRMTVAITTDASAIDLETARLANKAIALGGDDAVALSTAAFGLLCNTLEIERADTLLDRAIVLNPNLAMAWSFRGWAQVYIGQPASAIEHFHRALELSPRDPQAVTLYTGISCAHFVAGHHQEALEWNQKAQREKSSILLQSCIAAACHALLEQFPEARFWADDARRLFPALNTSNARCVMFFRNEDHHRKWKSALSLAGIPD